MLFVLLLFLRLLISTRRLSGGDIKVIDEFGSRGKGIVIIKGSGCGGRSCSRSKAETLLLLLLLLRLILGQAFDGERGRRNNGSSEFLFLVLRNHRLLGGIDLVLLLLLELKLLHEVANDNGRGTGTPNKTVDENLHSLVHSLVDESKSLFESTLNVFLDGIAKVDLLLLNSIAR